ncbi:aminomethyl-transferring glycine dehydrogenase subunit GcvPB [Paraliobacillus salinarum]|uniref:aminomethyl-transferring glycine dehydrogenase subunit GcvPB n=1 Tax=Paraliobacillus salinarum TaxID=1158996 RepID=UPI0015F736B9|nr:aminomethyl-transferring glycine dehydrogenase subunit GcvPB [Paraliobacillus salinarum]
MTTNNHPLLFELSKQGRVSYSLPELDVEETDLDSIVDSTYLRKESPELPEISELQLIRHYTNLSKRNYGVDSGFYPLGSCTMKYNPKLNEDVARLEGLSYIHPYQSTETVQGALAIMYDLQTSFEEITGMHRFTLQTAAGAHGEWAGLMMIRAFHEKNGDHQRTKVVIPDSAHGTNPASAAVAGFDPVTVQTNEQGLVDLDDLRRVVGNDTAALMLTNPNTLGLFEKEITEIAKIVHGSGGKLYYDGANLNAIMGYTRPGDMGFDVVHLNLHKTFTGPHGGGGPGSGPVGVSKEMEEFLPSPIVNKREDMYVLEHDRPNSIGRVKPYFGNFGINVRAYTYIRTMGAEGLKKASTYAVLNANYIMRRLESTFDLPFTQHCKHEFVLSGKKQKKLGVRTLDIAKRLLDYGYHPPTIYFPLNVAEAMMIEPTETESKETLDAFVDALLSIDQEAKEQPELVQEAPHTTVVKRMDETLAARKPIVKYEFES